MTGRACLKVLFWVFSDCVRSCLKLFWWRSKLACLVTSTPLWFLILATEGRLRLLICSCWTGCGRFWRAGVEFGGAPGGKGALDRCGCWKGIGKILRRWLCHERASRRQCWTRLSTWLGDGWGQVSFSAFVINDYKAINLNFYLIIVYLNNHNPTTVKLPYIWVIIALLILPDLLLISYILVSMDHFYRLPSPSRKCLYQAYLFLRCYFSASRSLYS